MVLLYKHKTVLNPDKNCLDKLIFVFFPNKLNKDCIAYKDEIYKTAYNLMKDADIKTDEQLFNLEEAGELEFHNNAWFEFSNADDIDHYSEPLHEAREAVLEAIKEMSK